jgi:hypothetical protein
VSGAPTEVSRRYVFPDPGDTLTTVAARELPSDDSAVQLLQSWNLHLLIRRPVGPDGALLPTDIVYVEPPVPDPVTVDTAPS